MAKNLGRQKIKEKKATKKAEAARVAEENQFNQDFDNYIKETIEKVKELFNAKINVGDFPNQAELDNVKINLLNNYANILKQAEGKNLSPEDSKKVKIIQKASQEISAKLDALYVEINQTINSKKQDRDAEKEKFTADKTKTVIDSIKDFHSKNGDLNSLNKELKSLKFYEQKVRDIVENGDNSQSSFDASKFVDNANKVRSPEGKKLLTEISLIDYTKNSEANTYKLNMYHNILEELCDKLTEVVEDAAEKQRLADEAAEKQRLADEAAAEEKAKEKAAADEKTSQTNIVKVLELPEDKALNILTEKCTAIEDDTSCDESSNHLVSIEKNHFCCPHGNFLEDYTLVVSGDTATDSSSDL
ncbi:MAG: hypothetical protein N4A31_03995 [Rickettsiales bacterium]|jgi:hypothetical protein|nr:hypothetical protein [Rickettsiales bacterium]